MNEYVELSEDPLTRADEYVNAYTSAQHQEDAAREMLGKLERVARLVQDELKYFDSDGFQISFTVGSPRR